MIFITVLVPFLLSAIVGYLIGSVNTAIIVTKVVTKGGNIKEMGSGNAGFTNVLRCVGKGPAIVTIVCDFLKAVISVLLSIPIYSLCVALISSLSQGEYAELFVLQNHTLILEGSEICKYVAGFFCILGHMFPIYFKLQGGKGVVAAIGMIAVLDWRTFLIILGLFLIIFAFSKIISLGSLICAALYGPVTFVVTYFFTYKPSLDTATQYSMSYVFAVSVLALLTGIIVIVKHHQNIGRLIRGEEKKITAKK